MVLLGLRQLGALIGSFGFGYAFVAARPAVNRDLIRLGIIGKSSFTSVVAVAFLTGLLPLAAALPAAIDVLFVLLFLWALRQISASEPPPAEL